MQSKVFLTTEVIKKRCQGKKLWREIEFVFRVINMTIQKRKYSKLHVCLFWYVCHSVFVYFVLFCLQSSTILVYFTWFILTILILYFLFVACCFIDSIALHIYNLLGDTSLKKCLQFHFVVCIQFVTHFSALFGNIR